MGTRRVQWLSSPTTVAGVILRYADGDYGHYPEKGVN
jgi:hypothetical protein